METYYTQAVLDYLGRRVVVLGVGDAMTVANEINKNFPKSISSDTEKFPSPAEMFLEQHKAETVKWNNGEDCKLMISGATTYNLGGFYVIFAEDSKKFTSGLLVHELFHVVKDIENSCGINDNEFEAHLGQYLFEKFTTKNVKPTEEIRFDGLIQPELF